MGTSPTVENAVDRQAASIVDTRTAEGSVVRFYNAAGDEFMTLTSDIVSRRFSSLFGEKLVGARHAEDGRFYAILKDGDSTREEPVDLFPFAEVRVGLTPRAKPTGCFNNNG